MCHGASAAEDGDDPYARFAASVPVRYREGCLRGG